MFEIQKTDEFDGWLSGLAIRRPKRKLLPALSASVSAIPVTSSQLARA